MLDMRRKNRRALRHKKDQSHKIILGLAALIFLLVIVSRIAVFASESGSFGKKKTNAINQTVTGKPTDMKIFLEHSITKECGKVNNLNKTTIRYDLITSDKTILVNINADVGLNKSDTKNKILKDTLNILKDLKNQDYTLITFSYFLPLQNHETLKNEDEQVLTVVFAKSEIGDKLNKINYSDLTQIARSIVIYKALK